MASKSPYPNFGRDLESVPPKLDFVHCQGRWPGLSRPLPRSYELWKARNLLVFEQQQLPHLKCFMMAMAIRLTIRKPTLGPFLASIDHLRWKPLEEGCFRYNSDASLIPQVQQELQVFLETTMGNHARLHPSSFWTMQCWNGGSEAFASSELKQPFKKATGMFLLS